MLFLLIFILFLPTKVGGYSPKFANICEIKYYQEKFVIKKVYEADLRHKIVCFQEETKTNKAINLVLLTTYGLKDNKYAGIIQKTVTINDIFRL